MYSVLFHTFGVLGLAWASDIGIAANLVVLAWLLHRKRFVPLWELRWKELGKAAIVAVLAAAVSFGVARVIPLPASGHASRLTDVMQLALVTLTWAAAVAGGLWLLRSELPGDFRRRRGAVYPAVAQGESKEILGSGAQP